MKKIGCFLQNFLRLIGTFSAIFQIQLKQLRMK